MSQTGCYHQVCTDRYLTCKPAKQSNGIKYDYQIRLIVVGDAATGKSTLVNRYFKDEKTMQQLDDSYQKQNLPRRKVLEKKQKKIHLQIVDTAGQERYRSLTSSYYLDSHGCLIVFDVTKENTFHSVFRWSQDLHEYAPNWVRAILVGTNCFSTKRKVSKERAENLASSIGLNYVEVSMQDNFNITEPFDKLIGTVIEYLEMKSMLYQLDEKRTITKGFCVIS